MKKNKYLHIFLSIFVLSFAFFCFYKINENNYEKHNEIKANTIEHPENLQKKETAKATAF
ncbi:MAG: hypothetical protein LBQ24_03240 [Candidatus Peribacteria bacterium]|jgi:hypothetical protein|nr:hypothetical protein [Candidatus Peribacteria bacterium]